MIMNKAAINILEQVFLWAYFHFSWIITRRGIARSKGTDMFKFIRNCQISQVVASFYFPTSSVREFELLYSLVNTCCCQSFKI